MGRKRKVDTATAETCWWSFVEDPAIMDRINACASRYARQYDMDAEELAQELVMQIAARPELEGRNLNMDLLIANVLEAKGMELQPHWTTDGCRAWAERKKNRQTILKKASH
jgi:hypothetical protein